MKSVRVYITNQSSIRAFHSSSLTRGLYTDYVSKIAPKVKTISPKELQATLFSNDFTKEPSTKHIHLLDIREPMEWNEDHIPFAVYTGRGNLERDIVF